MSDKDRGTQKKKLQAILDDDSLTHDEKRDRLNSLRSDLESRLEAESEGMSASNPIDMQQEGSLAAQLQAVVSAINELENDSTNSNDA